MVLKKICQKNVVIFSGVLILFLYINSLNCSWHLDDEPNILKNTPLHITDLFTETLAKTFYAHPETPGKFYRPIPCLTFALNWFFHQERIAGYHIVNVILHLMIAILLYYTCRQLLQTPLMSDRSALPISDTALLASILWAVNPVQTQAVTYIVQRMAQLAAFFYLAGIFFYIKARLSNNTSISISYAICCMLGFIVALGCKENTATFPLAILLVELTFFSPVIRFLPRSTKYRLTMIFVLFVTTTFFLYVFQEYFFSLLQGYEKRTFTLTQRFLTQPRVLLFHLTQLFYPVASRLSVEHDIILSNSLFKPWTTLPAILFCILMIVWAAYQVRKKPLLSFGILFFFTAHLIESTILPLELIFEHRNYLPSLFLFLPAAAWITRITTNQNLNIKWRSAIAAVIPLIVIFLGINTYIRNSAWVSEESLWRDALSKAPNSGRAAINLAKALYRSNKLEEALRLSEQAYDRRFPTINNAGALSFNGRGVVYYRRGNFESASDFFKKSLQFKPDNFEALTNLILTLLHLNQMEEALHYIANHGQQNPPLNILHLQGTILLKLNRPTEALHIFRNIQMKQPLSVESMIGIGRALTLLKHYRQADFFLRQTAKFSITGSFCAIENDLLAGNRLGAGKAVLEMAGRYPIEKVLKGLSSSMADPKEIPIDIQLLNPFVRRHTAMALAKQNDCRAYLNEPQNRNNMD